MFNVLTAIFCLLVGFATFLTHFLDPESAEQGALIISQVWMVAGIIIMSCTDFTKSDPPT